MNITDVRIRRIDDEGKMKAVVSVTFDDEFVVHDIKIINGLNGLFIAMPSRRAGDGSFRDIAHPLSSETRNKIKEHVFREYERILATEPKAVPEESLQDADPDSSDSEEDTPSES